jgi:hypothetical protein
MRDHDLVGFGDALQPRRQIRRAANGQPVVSFVLSRGPTTTSPVVMRMRTASGSVMLTPFTACTIPRADSTQRSAPYLCAAGIGRQAVSLTLSHVSLVSRHHLGASTAIGSHQVAIILRLVRNWDIEHQVSASGLDRDRSILRPPDDSAPKSLAQFHTC